MYSYSYVVFCFFLFFQAEDGIRDTSVTGVQTCALPILGAFRRAAGPFPSEAAQSDSRPDVGQNICLRIEALQDRKSTRLNSSHRCISYAVFCLKKKKKKANINSHRSKHNMITPNDVTRR